MAIAVQMDYRVDLCKPVHLIQMDVPFFKGDKNAHRFHVTLERNGCAIDACEISATGYMVRADKQTVIWDAQVDGCDIYLTMPASCYAVPGRFRLLLRVTSGDTVETALWVEGSIRESATDIIVDPDNVLPNLEELLAQIDELKSITAEARETLNVLNTASIVSTETGALVNVTDAAALPAHTVVSTIKPAQPGTGDPSPDNVRPIAGWNAVTLTRTGKNLLGFKDFSVGGESFIDSYSNGVFRREVTQYHATSYALGTTAFQNIENPHIPAGTYTFTLTHISGVTYLNPYLEVTLSDGSIVNLASGVATTLPLDGTITGIRMTSKSFSKGDTIEYVVQLEAGAGTAYEPYNGLTLTTNLPETVYGGTLDWTTGLLTVTHGADGAALAVPVTHQLAPQTLEMLKGCNAVWSDTGDTSVVYVADTKLYIDKKFAELTAAVLSTGANV